MTRHTFQSCEASFDGRTLRLANELVERRWRVEGGMLFAEAFFDKTARHEWITRPARVPSLYPPADLVEPLVVERVGMSDGVDRAMEAPALLVAIEAGAGAARLTYRFKLFPAARGVAIQLVMSGLPTFAPAPEPPEPASPTGIERDCGSPLTVPVPDTVECFDIDPRHVALTQVTLLDQTDVHDNLVFERTWHLSPAEPLLRAAGNLFILEQRLTGRGLIVAKFAPPPHARPVKSTDDLRMLGPTCHVVGGTNYVTAVLSYEGGRAGRIAALQQFQRLLRRPDRANDGVLLSNTWGDRSKDARICESFMLKELAAAQSLGVDVVQLDDGWQQGVSGNSVTPGGAWTGFWSRDANFWDPHPMRFPNGLTPLAHEASRLGLRLGLWFAPDSSGDFANWERDADTVLRYHCAHAINHFKLDGVKIHTLQGARNFERFVDAVLDGSDGEVIFDIDVTAALRPGYLGLVRAGNVFVENRYTDWRRYYPHATLRNLWQLAQHVDPVRLRMEFLNNARNAHLYGDDPLAPARYPLPYLFATIMIASPLAWFEVSNLAPNDLQHVAPLIATWKRHRDRLHGGTIIPVGEVPDGTSWTGFASLHADGSADLVVVRELNDRATASFDLPHTREDLSVALLAGAGEAAVQGRRVTVRIPAPRHFLWVRLWLPKSA